MLSPVYLGLAGNVAPPIELNLDLIWAKSVRSMSAFYNLPHPSLSLWLKRKLVNFNLLWAFENLNFKVGLGIFSTPPTKHVTPKNEKLDLGILQHLEQLLGLGWGISIYPPNHAHGTQK